MRLSEKINGGSTSSFLESLNEGMKVRPAKLTEARRNKEQNEKVAPREYNSHEYVDAKKEKELPKSKRVGVNSVGVSKFRRDDYEANEFGNTKELRDYKIKKLGAKRAENVGSKRTANRLNKEASAIVDNKRKARAKKQETNESALTEDTENKTKVIFRKDKEDGEIIAVFPEEIETDGTMACYVHNGQHTTMSKDYYGETLQAKPSEYNDLKKELEDIVGYNLEIVKSIKESAKTITLRPTSAKLTEAESIELKDEYAISDLDNLVWSGAADRWLEMPDEVKEYLLDLINDMTGYGETIWTITEFNDFIWFEADDILEDAGYDINNGYVMRDEEDIEESCGTKKKINEDELELVDDTEIPSETIEEPTESLEDKVDEIADTVEAIADVVGANTDEELPVEESCGTKKKTK